MLFGIRMIPYGSRYLAEASQSIRKIQEMLNYPTFDQQIPHPKNYDTAIQMKNAKFIWDTVEEEKPKEDTKKNGKVPNGENGKLPNENNAEESVPLTIENPIGKSDFSLSNINLIIQKVRCF